MREEVLRHWIVWSLHNKASKSSECEPVWEKLDLLSQDFVVVRVLV